MEVHSRGKIRIPKRNITENVARQYRLNKLKKEVKMFNTMNGHGWGMGWGWFLGLVILVAVIWIIIKSINQNNQAQANQKTLLDILKERYARGEIDKQEFEERKKELM